MSQNKELGRPTIEEKLAWYEAQKEHRPAMKIEERIAEQQSDPGCVAENKRKNAIIANFRRGVRRFCVGKLWEKIENTLRTKSKTALAITLKMRRNQIYRFCSGDMTLDDFFVVLSELTATLRSHPSSSVERSEWNYKPPPVQEQALAGYQAAIYFCQTGKELRLSERERFGISLETLQATRLLWGDATYRAICDDGRTPTESEWNHIATRLCGMLATVLGVEKESLTYRNGPDLSTLPGRWLEAVAEADAVIPHRWQREANS